MENALMIPAIAYAERLRRLFQPQSIVSYLPLWEPSGSVAFDYNSYGRNGAYTGVTLGQPGIGDGRTCPLFDGVNDYCNWYGASLQAAFNSQTGTLMSWGKVSGTEVWADGIARDIAVLRVDANNLIALTKPAVANSLRIFYIAGAVNDSITATVTPNLNWYHWVATWDKPNDALNGYLNSAVQTPAATLGAWSGSLATADIGAQQGGITEFWSGNLAHIILLNRVATAAEIQQAYSMAF